MLSISTRTILFASTLFALVLSTHGWSSQGQDVDCNKYPTHPKCIPRPTPKCGPGTNRKCPPKTTPTPALIEERNPALIPIRYNQDKAGRINWRDKNTGAIKQSDGKFTLYNEYTFDVKKSDHFVIRLDPANYPWEIQLIEGSSQDPINIKRTQTPGEFQLNGRLPNDGRYRILVRYSDLNEAATRFSATYSLRIITTTSPLPSAPLPTPKPTPSPKPLPTPKPIPTLGPEDYSKLGYEALNSGRIDDARRDYEKALKLGGKVVFNIKTPDKCTDKIDLKGNNSSNIDNKPTRQLEIQAGRIEVKENGNRFSKCFDPDALRTQPEVQVWLQAKKNDKKKDDAKKSDKEAAELMIVEIREFKMKKDKKVEGDTYRFFPVSKNLDEARLIRDLIDAYFINKR